MRCQCTEPALSLRRAGESFLDSNVTMVAMQFYCANCGNPHRCPGLSDGLSINEPWSDDDGLTIMIPLVPEGEAPLVTSLQ